MTLLEAMAEARRWNDLVPLAVFVRNTLGIDAPCGIEPFEVTLYCDGTDGPDGDQVMHHRITVGDTNCLRQGQQLTSDEARGMARLLLMAADECDEANGR